ncbi:MAG: hypothetical protein HYW27_02500 [Candidatus Aenigmarchaeota archaeon]|nr:hypothetical protein [Candidatus Aenigmarchaeota archaeon]
MRNFAVMLFISFLFLFATAGFAAYQVYSDATVIAGQPFYVKGNTSGSVQYNVSVNITGNNANNSFSSAGGYFEVNVTAPVVTGEYNITVLSGNDSSTKVITIYVTNISQQFSSISFTDKKPPFAAASSFRINITMRSSSNALLVNYTPVVEVYSANGKRQTAWTIANMTPANNHSGFLEYNITIPSGVDGSYVISVDRGNIISIIVIKSGYVMALGTQTSLNETKFDYTPGNSTTIVAKIRDTDGNPIGNAINVTVKVTRPDGTITTVTLTNDTSVFGQYKGDYTLNDTQTGQYTIKGTAVAGTTSLESSSLMNSQKIKSIFDTQKEFFREWGDSSAFVPGGTVGLNIITTNLTDSSIFSGSTRASPAAGTVNCTKIADTLQVFYSNGTPYSISGSITNDSSGTYYSQSVCRVQFSAPSENGNYKITANASVGTGSPYTNAAGYFSVNRFVLKPTAVSSLGGSFDFMTMLYPGENSTFDLGAYDLSNNTEIAGINITNITVTKVIPLEFNAGASDIKEGASGRADSFNTTNITAGSSTKNPSVTVTLPVNKTGPYLIEMQAIIHTTEANTTVNGRGFYIAKYIMGFLSSQGKTDAAFSGPSGGFGGFSSCSEGTEKFSGSVTELKTNSAPSDPVSFSNILQAREELTGKDISSCLSMATNSSDSTGQIAIPVTFNRTKAGCESLSGFYFMLVNVSYQGKADQVPAGFMCRQYSFFVQGKDSSGSNVWRVDSRGSINFTVDSTNAIRRLNDSATMKNGTMTMIRAFNFNPGTGMQILTLNSSANLSANVSNQVMSLVVTPSLFSRATYPSGFISITWRFTPNASEGTGTDTTETGFQVAAFDAYVENTERPTTGGACGAGATCLTNGTGGGFGGFGSTFSAGDDIVLWIRASTNVSKVNNSDNANTTKGQLLVGTQSLIGFTAKVGLPWEGKLKPVTINNATLITDDWNGTQDRAYPRWGAELWRVNVTIPAALKKGFQTLQIEVNSSANNNSGEKVTTDVWFSIVKYSVVIGQEEGMTFENNFLIWGNYSNITLGTGGNTTPGQFVDNTTIFNKGWNLTAVNYTYNLRSKSDRVCIRNEINVTRWSQGSSAISYNRTAKVLVLDNTTAGVYDTVLVNMSDGFGNLRIIRIDGLRNVTYWGVVHNASRNVTTDLYLWQLLDCGYIKWINASFVPSNIGSWGGQYEKGVNFTVPYIIKRSSSSGPAVSAATVSVNGIIKQNDASGSGGSATGGFGFSKKLTADEYNSTGTVTASNGLAFVPVNINGPTGSFMVFWRVNESSGQEDTASFKSEGFGGHGGGSASGDIGTQVQIRSFDAWGSKIPKVNGSYAAIPILLRKITGADNPTTIYGLNIGAAGNSVYNTTWNEAVGGQLVQDTSLKNYTILYNFSLANYGPNASAIGNSAGPSFTTADISTTFSNTVDSKSVSIGAARNTDGENLTLAFYEDSSSQVNYPMINASQNITIRVCAQTFTKPQKPVLGATVYLYAESWGSGSGFGGSATTTALEWYDPINRTPYLFGPVSGNSLPVANATVGPKGCVALDIRHPSGWSAYTSYSIKAKVKDASGNEEDTYADYVWRNSQCSNGIDDDADGKIDYLSWGGGASSDPECSTYSDDSEAA